MVLALTQQHMSEMSAHAERVYPEECCGLMLGQIDRQAACAAASDSAIHKHVVELVPVDNQWLLDDSSDTDLTSDIALSKARRYAIAPKDMLRVQKQARAKSLKIIGIYHSHPDHDAVPSECDRAQAWPEYAYTILSVKQGKTADICNWALDSNHQFQPEAMQICPTSATDRMPLPA